MSGISSVLTTEQAEVVVRRHLAGHSRSVVWQITEIKNKGYRCVVRLLLLYCGSDEEKFQFYLWIPNMYLGFSTSKLAP